MLRTFWRPNRMFGPPTPGRFGPAHNSWFNSVMGQGVSNADLNTKQFDWIPYWAAWSISSREPWTLRSFEMEVSEMVFYVERWIFSFFLSSEFRSSEEIFWVHFSEFRKLSCSHGLMTSINWNWCDHLMISTVMWSQVDDPQSINQCFIECSLL